MSNDYSIGVSPLVLIAETTPPNIRDTVTFHFGVLTQPPNWLLILQGIGNVLGFMSESFELSPAAEHFFENGGFSLSAVDVSSSSVPPTHHQAWNVTLIRNQVHLLGELRSHIRYMDAKERYLNLFPIISEGVSPCQWPALFLVVAESLFWLGDLSMSYTLLSRLGEVLVEDTQLQCLLRHFDEILTKEANEDEAYHQIRGIENTFEFVTPMGCPEESTLSERLNNVQTIWESMQNREKSVLEEFTRLVCVSTNVLEEVFRIEGSSWPRLIRRGFYANSIVGISQNSRVKRKNQILRILENTQNCLAQISFVLDSPSQFTVEFIKGLHSTLLFHNNFAEEVVDDVVVIRVIRAGEFRRVACLTFHNDEKDVVQLCHRNDIAQEMERYCEEARRIMVDESIDPFMKAAWMQWAFCRIHPFEDGNGRVSRILASVPLCKYGLPPIVVTPEYKSEYFAALHQADRQNDLAPLAGFFYQSMIRGMAYLESLPLETSLSSGLSVPRLRDRQQTLAVSATIERTTRGCQWT